MPSLCQVRDDLRHSFLVREIGCDDRSLPPQLLYFVVCFLIAFVSLKYSGQIPTPLRGQDTAVPVPLRPESSYLDENDIGARFSQRQSHSSSNPSRCSRQHSRLACQGEQLRHALHPCRQRAYQLEFPVRPVSKIPVRGTAAEHSAFEVVEMEFSYIMLDGSHEQYSVWAIPGDDTDLFTMRHTPLRGRSAFDTLRVTHSTRRREGKLEVDSAPLSTQPRRSAERMTEHRLNSTITRYIFRYSRLGNTFLPNTTNDAVGNMQEPNRQAFNHCHCVSKLLTTKLIQP